MGKCSVCGKKLGIFQGYETFDKEFCEDCWNKRVEEKDMKDNKKVEERKEKLEKLKNPNEKELLIQILDKLKWIGLILLGILMYFILR